MNNQTKTISRMAAILALVSLCGCMTHATVRKASGYPADDGHGQKVATEERQPGYYALVPFAFIGDVATCPVQGIYALIVWPFLPPDVRKELNQD